MYLPAFYAQELHLTAGLVGLVFLVARLWDGLADILIGWGSDRSTFRLGRRKPWVILGAPLLMVSTWYLCNPHPNASFVYLAFWVALFYTSFTAVKIPHLSWGTELATDYVERSRVTTYREAFTMLGNLLFVSLPLVFLSNDAPLREVLFLITLAVLATVPVTALAASLQVPDRPSRDGAETHLLKGLIALARDRVLMRFLTARLLWAVEEGIGNSLLLFSIGVGLNLPDKFFWAIFILYVATLSAMPLTLRLARRVEKHKILAGGIAIQALVFGCFLVIPAGHFVPVAVLWAVVGMANTAMLSLPTSILADIIDRDEALTGRRRSGAYVALDNLVFKIGMALGVGISFGLLSLVDYDPSAAHHSAADARNVLWLGFGLPCVLSVLAGLTYLTHPITRAVQQALRAQIDARDAEGLACSSAAR